MLPQLSGYDDGIELDRFPPLRFVTPVVQDTMVGSAERNRELVADPAAERPRLGESQMVGVRRPASAQQTRLRGYELEVRTITVATWFAQREGAFIDMPVDGIVHALFGPGADERRAVVILRRHRRSGHTGQSEAIHSPDEWASTARQHGRAKRFPFDQP
jgi:hypothetical protein